MKDQRSLFGVATIAAIIVGVALAQPGCLVESACASDDDCPYPQQCGVDGQCFLECSATSPDICPEARPNCLVAESRCVECLDAADCQGDDQCVSNTCVPSQAPGFTLVDTNPTSPTADTEVSLSDYEGEVVLIFFAGLG